MSGSRAAGESVRTVRAPGSVMRANLMLRSASVLSVLLFIVHMVDDITRGYEEGNAGDLTAIAIFVLWLCGPLLLGNRRSGYVIMMLGGLFGLLPALAHMRGQGLGAARIVESDGAFFFIFTIIVLGVTALFAFMLATVGLWHMLRRLHDAADGERTVTKTTTPDTVITRGG